MFTIFNEDDAYDTIDAAIERAKMLRNWGDPNTRIFVHRKYVPLWFAHLVQGTWLEGLAYEELKG